MEAAWQPNQISYQTIMVRLPYRTPTHAHTSGLSRSGEKTRITERFSN